MFELELENFFHKTSVRKFCNKYFTRFIFNISLRYQIDPLRDQVSTAFCSEWIFLHFQFHNRLLWKMSLYTTCVNFFPLSLWRAKRNLFTNTSKNTTTNAGEIFLHTFKGDYKTNLLKERFINTKLNLERFLNKWVEIF